MDVGFPNSWMRRNTQVQWPDKFPDNNPFDFRYWRNMKSLRDDTPVELDGDLMERIAVISTDVSEYAKTLCIECVNIW